MDPDLIPVFELNKYPRIYWLKKSCPTYRYINTLFGSAFQMLTYDQGRLVNADQKNRAEKEMSTLNGLRTCFEGFDGNRRGIVPESLPDLPELSVSELADKLETGALNLPLVPRVVGQVRRHRLLNLDTRKVSFRIAITVGTVSTYLRKGTVPYLHSCLLK